MRGRLTAGTMLVALLTGMALAGCAPQLPAEVDEKLTDDWAKVAQVKGYVPEVGICLGSEPRDLANTGRMSDFVVDCAKDHYGEVVHVGEFKGLTGEPAPKDRAAALTECDAKAAAYLGMPWGLTRTDMVLTVPTDAAWDGGARWFRCDLIEVDSVFDNRDYVKRTGSLKGAVPPLLLVGCTKAVIKNDKITSMPEIGCSKSHNSEFVGVFRASMTTAFPTSDRQWDVLHRGCRDLITSYVGVSKSVGSRSGAISSPNSSKEWELGDRIVRCSLWFNGKMMAKSAKGSKGKGIPGW